LEQWMKLGLVPKKEIERHKEEIENLKGRINDEKQRLQFLKESGESEEFTAPKRTPGKTVYTEAQGMSEMEFGENTEAGLEIETEATTELETVDEERDQVTEEEFDEREDEEDPFSDRNRWKRGGIIDPDTTEW
ncbi:MAG: hypothetical protein WAM28_08270, partial [Chlamydiales bacterium]